MSFYAVKRGRKRGIFNSWKECSAQVHKYQGACFKKFNNKQEAELFVKSLKTDSKTSPGSSPKASKAPVKKKKTEDCNEKIVLKFYTDGSCISNVNVSKNVYPAGYGIVFLTASSQSSSTDIKPVLEKYGRLVLEPTDMNFLGAEVTSNNTAELTAIGEVFKLLLTPNFSYPVKDLLAPQRVDKVEIYTDSKYAMKSIMQTQKSVMNLSLIQNIIKMRQEVVDKGYKIDFIKVKGHSTNIYNNRADRLASRGAKLEQNYVVNVTWQ